MTQGPAPLAELEDRLRRAGHDVASSLATVDVTPAVLAALTHSSRSLGRRRWPALAAVAAVLAGTTTLAIPSARAGVARWLGVADGVVDVRIEPFPGELPTPVPAQPSSPPGAQLFGDTVTAAEAIERTGLPIPAPDLLGQPDALYLDASGRRIIAVYAPSSTLPAGEVDGVGAIVEVIRGSFERSLYVKNIGPEDAASTEVDGAPALFLGSSHPLSYRDETGSPVTETARLAGTTLLWGDDGVVLRLESSLDLPAAVALAESIP